jgi:hypothetical protein
MKFLYLLFLFKEILQVFCFTNINVDTTGLLIPYSIGALGYIKTNLSNKDYHLTGISGGSFASVIYYLEKDLSNHNYIWNKLIGDDNYTVKFNKNLEEFQQIIKKNIINGYKDFDITNIPVSIIVSKIEKMQIINKKINKFADLEELIEYCICSSYIPYMCGKTFTKKYKNENYIDGGIFKNIHHFDCVDKCENSIHISRKMANRNFDYYDHLYLDKKISNKLFNYGWNDCKKLLE